MKASFQLTLAAPPSATVLTNMPPARDASVDPVTHLRIWEFQATPVMSTYLNAWVIGTLHAPYICHIVDVTLPMHSATPKQVMQTVLDSTAVQPLAPFDDKVTFADSWAPVLDHVWDWAYSL